MASGSVEDLIGISLGSWMSSAPKPLFLIILPLLLVLFYINYRSWKRLSHVPGPAIAHFSIIWLARHAWRGNLFPCLIGAGDTYGALTRIGPNLLLCSDADELRRISGIRSEYTKGPAYNAGRVTNGDTHVASERDPVKHKALRAKMGPAYSTDIQSALDRQVLELIKLIKRKYASGQFARSTADCQHSNPGVFMDFGEKMHFYTFDCVGDFAFGQPFGLLKNDEDIYQMTTGIDSVLPLISIAGLVPWLTSLRSRWPFKLFLPKDGDKKGFGVLYSFAKDLVNRRTEPGAEPINDMMGMFIKSGMTRDQLVQQVFIHMIAGADSSSNWARMIMLCLLTCPPAYLCLQQEIDAASSSGNLSLPIATDAEGRALPYLDGVLREAIRLYPPSVSPSKLSPIKPRKETGGTDIVCGFRVPGGTQIGANVPCLLRSKTIFGPDADCFRPERWLEAKAEMDENRLRRMVSTLDLAFGAGKYQCLGKAIAWMEVRKLFVELMRRFDFAIVNNKAPLHLESFAIMVVHGFNVRVSCRDA